MGKDFLQDNGLGLRVARQVRPCIQSHKKGKPYMVLKRKSVCSANRERQNI
jgi:hypothetical protein